MREIKLSQGKSALVDDEDFEYLSQWKWHAYEKHGNFYARRNTKLENGKRTTVDMHQIIAGKGPVNTEIDHRDGNGLNNQRQNLRFVTSRQNKQNLHISKTSRYPGVYFDKDAGRWKAQIKIRGTYKTLGRYQHEEDAFRSYCNALSRVGETMVGIAV